MDVDHEFVEMHPALAHHRARLEEQIHEHGLAAPDLAVDVEALDPRRGFGAAGKQPPQRGRLARQTNLGDSRFEPRQFFGDGKLRVVMLNSAGGNGGDVSCSN